MYYIKTRFFYHQETSNDPSQPLEMFFSLGEVYAGLIWFLWIFIGFFILLLNKPIKTKHKTISILTYSVLVIGLLGLFLYIASGTPIIG